MHWQCEGAPWDKREWTDGKYRTSLFGRRAVRKRTRSVQDACLILRRVAPLDPPDGCLEHLLHQHSFIHINRQSMHALCSVHEHVEAEWNNRHEYVHAF